MRIHSLTLKGFRNLKKTQLDFSGEGDVVVFLGGNGQGKTNLLEAIYLSALSKSFRTRTNEDLVGFEEAFCSVKTMLSGDEERELELIITRAPAQKVLKINGVKKTAVDFVGALKAVFFSPDDLSQMAFAPRLRRRYLDVILSQLDGHYLHDLMRYQEGRKQRNALLKSIKEGKAKEDQLTFWDETLTGEGIRIIRKRKELIQVLKERLEQRYRAIAQTEDRVGIEYLHDDEIHDEAAFLEKLKKTRSRDIMLTKTESGPHRDDLGFRLNERDMAFFASRGEWRSLVLALKFCEIDLIREVAGTQPVLLLDDVFSELDDRRQKYLFSAIKGSQTFITTTHREFVREGEGARILELKGGEISGD